MKKKFLVGVVASVVAVGGAVGASAFSDSLGGNQGNKMEVKGEADTVVSIDTKTMISADELHDIVLGEVDGAIVEIELDSEGETVYFEVEVKKDRVEYEVYVDAYTGKVLKVEKDDQSEKKNNQTVKGNTSVKNTANSTTSTKVEKNDDDNDDDDDREIKVESSQSAKVNDTTKTESNVSQKDSNNKKSDIISRDEAVRIALGLAQGRVVEVELDDDDGRLYYEIEIELDADIEAEIEIDAYTGKVIEFELDN